MAVLRCLPLLAWLLRYTRTLLHLPLGPTTPNKPTHQHTTTPHHPLSHTTYLFIPPYQHILLIHPITLLSTLILPFPVILLLTTPYP